MNWGEIVGAAVAVATVAGFIIKFLVADWFKKTQVIEKLKADKAKEVEALKAEKQKILMDRFEKNINDLGTKMRSFETRLHDFEKKQITMNSYVDSVTRLFENALESAKRVSDGLDKKVNEAVRTEVLKLKDDLLMVRKKRELNGK